MLYKKQEVGFFGSNKRLRFMPKLGRRLGEEPKHPPWREALQETCDSTSEPAKVKPWLSRA